MEIVGERGGRKVLQQRQSGLASLIEVLLNVSLQFLGLQLSFSSGKEYGPVVATSCRQKPVLYGLLADLGHVGVHVSDRQ